MSEDIRPKQPHVVVCIPVYAGMDARPFYSFMMMQRQWALWEQAGICKVRLLAPGPKWKIQYARNMAVEQAIQSNATHVLFIDDDFMCPEETLLKLVAHNVDIVGPLFFRGGTDFAPMIFKMEDRGDGNGMNLWTHESWEPNTMMEVDAIGTGCLLIKTEVFKKIGPPYFYFPEAIQARTMDLQFCVRAKKRGCKIYCDTSFECDQLGVPPVINSQTYIDAQLKRKAGENHEESGQGTELSEIR